jgi:type II secretory pathway pseudopilin PulG
MRASQQRGCGSRRAYTFVEVMVAVGVIGVLFVSLYLAFSAAFSVIQVARENLRATQILVQRAETLRLYTWSQLTNSAYFQTNFTDNYAPLGATYYGSISLSQPTYLGSPSYLADIKAVTISVRWTNGIGTPVPHYREMRTQVARWGMQNYVYGYRQ